MRMPETDADTLARAQRGAPDAIDALLRAVEPAVLNLAIRMLGHREDARDATQEILLRVATHLGSLAEPGAFGTWVFRIARNHLLTARTRRAEQPETGFEDVATRLAAGLAFAAAAPQDPVLTPEDKAAAREVAVRCTQGMLMCLDRPHRLAYVLDVVFGLSSEAAGAVAEVTPEAHRKRLSRARAAIRDFAGAQCGLVGDAAACRCERQLPGTRAREAASPPPLRLSAAERAEATLRLDHMARLGDAAALFRAHPAYAEPRALAAAVRALLAQAPQTAG